MGTLSVVPETTTATTSECERAEFADFWLLYPRRIAKKAAAQAWSRMSAAQQMDALVALVEWRRIWARKEIDYIPHPATWLNGERWEDELPAEASTSHASHVPVLAAEGAPQRGAMPEKVRALLEKLRAR